MSHFDKIIPSNPFPVLDGPGDGEEAVDGDGRVVQQRAQRRERRSRPPHLK